MIIRQLDIQCAETAEQLAGIPNVDEKLLHNALSVLQEQGLYACFLYLKAQGKEHTNNMSSQMCKFLRNLPVLNSPQNVGNELREIAKLANDLDKLLFARELLLQVLMYARYHLKAKSNSGNKQ